MKKTIEKKEEIRQRIISVLKDNVSTVYKTLGWDQQKVQKWSKGTLPGIECIEEMCDVLGLSVEWLLTGKEAPEPVQKIIVQTVPKMQTFHQDFAENNFLAVRLIKDSIAAGHPSNIRDNDIDGYCLIYSDKSWICHNPEDYTCVRVSGESMYPILSKGDIVAICHAERNPFDLDKKMVAFKKNGGVTIKWLKVLDDGTVVGVPENRYEIDTIITLAGDELETGIVGKVAWWWAKQT